MFFALFFFFQLSRFVAPFLLLSFVSFFLFPSSRQVRVLDKPFVMPIEGVHSIPGRGTVATGRVEQGIVKVGQDLEVLGWFRSSRRAVVVTSEVLGLLVARVQQ